MIAATSGPGVSSIRAGGVAVLAYLLFVGLSGCGANVSFKPGAQGEAIANDERACRAASEDDEGYRTCMTERGYLVVDEESLRMGSD